MKQAKAIFITAIITLLTIGSVVYTSCKKDYCKGHTCLHGGTCNDGFCTCPSGYTGTYCEVGNESNISLSNQTFTPVLVVVNGVTYTVDTGTSIVFTGAYGDTLKG